MKLRRLLLVIILCIITVITIKFQYDLVLAGKQWENSLQRQQYTEYYSYTEVERIK
ncbi:MAG: hypothetical protein ACOWWR_19655 [Eubacteriales bacterium]